MTFERIRDLLVNQFEIDPSKITEEAAFSDLGIDSLDTAEIMMEAEDEFGIEIAMAEAGKSVGELVKYIDSKLAQ